MIPNIFYFYFILFLRDHNIFKCDNAFKDDSLKSERFACVSKTFSQIYRSHSTTALHYTVINDTDSEVRKTGAFTTTTTTKKSMKTKEIR